MSWVENILGTGIADPSGPVIQPMYGVPVVKYGPPSPAPYVPGYTGPSFSGMPSFDFNKMWQPPAFSMPDLGHLGFSFPKLMAGIAFVAYLALMALMIGGLTVRGGAWYLKKRVKK